MTNETRYAPCRLKCNGATKNFPFGFQVHKNNELIVNLINTQTQEVALLVEGSDYSVKLEAVGGNVNTINAFTSEYEIELSRKTSNFQEKTFSTSAGFQGSELENAFDRISCNLQDMEYSIETFKEDYSAEINNEIKEFETSVTTKITAIEAESNDKIAQNKTDTDKQIADFRTEVNDTIGAVIEAADKVNQLENAVAEANTAVTNANIAANNASASASAANESVIETQGLIQVANELIEDVQESLDTRANKDLSNLSEEGEKHFLGKSQITNCITEIPQRIKIELDSTNKKLTLKAGSEVIVPNGFEADGTTPKFDYVTVESDIVGSTGTGNYFYCYNPSQNLFGATQIASSGSSVASPQNAQYWYDTTNNIVKRYTNNDWIEGYSLPFCVASTEGIKNIFNGFGYIGSTLWVDKGVKGLIPNGRNEDGSLKNFEFTIDRLLTNTQTNTAGKTWGLYFNADGSHQGFSLGVYKKSIRTLSDRPTNWVGGYCIYVEDENKNYVNQSTVPAIVIMVADVVIGSTSITSLTPKLPFQAVDYNDAVLKDTLIDVSDAGIGFLSEKSVDLVLGASGSSYTAPANGWAVISKKTSAANQYVSVGIGSSIRDICYIPISGSSAGASVQVRKGQAFYCTYSAGGTLDFFRFIYAQGEL